jgi:hypothetical protein
MSTPGAFRRDTGSGTGEPAGEADRRDQSRFLDVLFDEGSKEGGRHAKDVDWPCNIRSSLLFGRTNNKIMVKYSVALSVPGGGRSG